MEKGIKLKVKEDCFCEGYLHEKCHYPRYWLKEKKLQKNDVVELKGEWSNFYGTYFRVIKEGEYYDLLPPNLEEVV
ncbi:hypothetical protein GOV13_04385 [Candidatus Pacearchaeota archaeon]|nr:hypothetical protein [Candidatus Pacearchaeota archaeon]